MEEEFDAIIWCTGFGYDTDHLKTLVKTDERGIAHTQESKSLDAEGLWLVGYGSWTEYASATLIGLNRTAKQTIKETTEYLMSDIHLKYWIAPKSHLKHNSL